LLSKAHARWFVTTLVATVVALSILADSGLSTRRVVTGTVVEFHAGEWISVVNDTTDPTGLRIALRDTTAYQGREHEFVDPVGIKPGVRVSVWYRSVGERRPVADTVLVLLDSAKPLSWLAGDSRADSLHRL
jgi:hypothetical protein